MRAGPYDRPEQSLANKTDFLWNICSLWVVTTAAAYTATSIEFFLQEKYHHQLDNHPALVVELG